MYAALIASRWLCTALLVSGVVTMVGGASHGALILQSDNAGPSWPGSAPVRTSALTGGGSRGVRLERIHAQTFQVTSTFNVDQIFLGYQWAANLANPTYVRLVEVEDVFATSYVAGNQIAAPLQINTGAEPAPDPVNNPNRIYAFQMHWDPSSSGGQPLTLTPRTGNQGYAIEITGTGSGAGTSPISIINRAINIYPLGRPYEMISGSPGTAITNNTEFEVVITAIPPPLVPGDFDGDGNVDAADFAVWQANFPKDAAGTLGSGDADGDGDVDGADFVVWQTHLSAASSAGVAAVPEPAAAELLFAGGMAILMVRWRMRTARTDQAKVSEFV